MKLVLFRDIPWTARRLSVLKHPGIAIPPRPSFLRACHTRGNAVPNLSIDKALAAFRWYDTQRYELIRVAPPAPDKRTRQPTSIESSHS